MRYYFGILAIIIFLFFGVKLALGTGKKSTTKVVTTKNSTAIVKAKLSDYSSTDAEVSITTEGPVVAHEVHNAVRIVVARNERRIEIINGYNNLIIRSKVYDNNQTAYDVFLHAIEYAGYMTEVKPQIADDTGVCATGNKYIYELSNTGNKDTDKRLWAVTCGVGIGNAGGNGPAFRDLFQKQIPDYGTVMSGVVI